MNVPRETKLECYAALVESENERQNLIAASTLPEFRSRHIEDSLQLTSFASADAQWIDVGSGAGLTGIPIAIAAPESRMVLVEPRTKRADFLLRCVSELDLTHRVQVIRSTIERVTNISADVITARAVASLTKLFALTRHLAHPETRWLLPKGRTAADEIEEAQHRWSFDFERHPSRTAPESTIIIAHNVVPRGQR